MVSDILDAVPSTVSKIAGNNSDDTADRLSHRYTVLILIVFAVVVSSGQFVGDPIHCWTPAEFDEADEWQKYTDNICWISNTYYIPMEDAIPSEIQPRKDEEITYYQWVPIILLFQAFLFKFPNLIWKLLHGISGVNLDKIVIMSENTQCSSPSDRKDEIHNLAIYINKWLGTYQEYRTNIYIRTKQKAQRFCFLLCDKRGGTFLIGLFITVKILYVVNIIAQFFLLNAFMSTNFNLYGFEIIQSFADGSSFQESPRFPRVTLCDFQIRQLQNIQRWTVQCVLPVNLFNEKIFIFLWFWFCLVACVAVANLIKWIIYELYQKSKVQYVKKYLNITNQLETEYDKKLCVKFANTYLRNDGIFIMYIIANNSTDMVVTDLIQELWKMFKDMHKPERNSYNGGEKEHFVTDK